MAKIIAVIGDQKCSEEIKKLAYEVGGLIARRGCHLICGGYGGVMEAACRGAKEAGGLTIGVLSGKDSTDMNPAIQIPIVTGMRDARNVIIPRTADGVIAVGGSYGTLSEIGFSLKFGKPFVGLRTWRLEHADSSRVPDYPNLNTPSEAVNALFKHLPA